MAALNPFSIIYSANLSAPATGEIVGGGSDNYQLLGPYIFDNSFGALRLVFDVVVVATTYASLQSLSDSLQDAFRNRDKDLRISIAGNNWSYTHGTHILNTVSSCSKTGNPETDRGYSRSYTCTVEGELPSDDAASSVGSLSGLREIEWNVDFEAGGQRVVSCRGVYTTATVTAGLQSATTNYEADTGADQEATTFIGALSGSATYELVDEQFTSDRNDHICSFTRQYVELLISQTSTPLAGGIETSATNSIRDHRIVFTDLSQHPGDSKKDIYRLRRVIGSYDCAIDINSSVTNPHTVFDDTVKPHVIALFQENFSPVVFCIEDMRESYDETAKRMSVSMQFLYQKTGGDDVVEVSQSRAFREARTIDYTPIHGENEFEMYADPGWIALERITSRTVIVLGFETPKRRLGVPPPGEGPAGEIEDVEANGQKVAKDGWNIVQNTSQVTRQWLGDPTAPDGQLETAILNETVVERFHKMPGGGGASGPTTGTRPPTEPIKPSGPTTPGGG